MINLVLIPAGSALLAALLIAEKKGGKAAVIPVKSILSCLFVLVALLQPRPLPQYAWAVTAGLAVSVVGDVCLAVPGQRTFLAGLVAFLAAHLLYCFGFHAGAEKNLWSSLGTAIIFPAGGIVYLWLRARLDRMKIPVMVYILVVSLMLAWAWSVLGNEAFHRSGRFLCFAGALCFYVSDLFVARDRFVSPGFSNRLIGLPLYYSGQFLLAFSIGKMLLPE